MPRGSLYVPSVIPGNSAERVGYPASTLVPRRAGAEYADQWNAALGTGVAPDFVTITSFNEWHEGTAIEPATSGYVSASGRRYKDFSPVSETGYLNQTLKFVTRFTNAKFPSAHASPIRIRVTSSSDWSSIALSTGLLFRPSLRQVSATATVASFTGDELDLNQPLALAEAAHSVTMYYDFSAAGPTLTFAHAGGDIGETTIAVEVRVGARWQEARTLTWKGSQGNRRTLVVTLT